MAAAVQARRIHPNHALNPGDSELAPSSSDLKVLGAAVRRAQAAGLAGNTADALIISLQERQRVLTSAWQADDTSTEELRIALQHYRAFWNRLEEFPRQP